MYAYRTYDVAVSETGRVTISNSTNGLGYVVATLPATAAAATIRLLNSLLTHTATPMESPA